MIRRLTARTAPLGDEQLAFAWHAASLLLGYPEDDLLTQLEPLHWTSHVLPDEVGGPLRATVVHLERAPLPQLQQEYVKTFDAVCPSHLCVVLEHAATTAPGVGRVMLAGFREDLERLRSALREMESGWVGALQAVTATLCLVSGDA